MTRTKDETLRVAAYALKRAGGVASDMANMEDAATVLEAVGFFRLEEQRDESIAVLRSVEWSGGMEGTDADEDDFIVAPCCPSCGVPSSEVGTHEDDESVPGVHDESCRLAKAIR